MREMDKAAHKMGKAMRKMDKAMHEVDIAVEKEQIASVEPDKTITRFGSSERMFHNVVMLTYFLLLMTGLVIITYNLKGDRDIIRHYFVIAHKAAGVMFLTGTISVVLFGNKMVWLENLWLLIKFDINDIKWLLKKPFTLFNKKIKLPQSDKFNAGQKVWHAIAFSGSFTLALTGVILWNNRLSIIALLVHTALAIIMIFPLMGHMYMALINKDTRPGFNSIINGRVDSKWAQSHHPKWVERKQRDQSGRKKVRRHKLAG